VGALKRRGGKSREGGGGGEFSAEAERRGRQAGRGEGTPASSPARGSPLRFACPVVSWVRRLFIRWARARGRASGGRSLGLGRGRK
jgi:hypothetical protein